MHVEISAMDQYVNKVVEGYIRTLLEEQGPYII